MLSLQFSGNLLSVIVKSQVVALLNEALKQTARLRKGGNEIIYFCPFCLHRKQKLEICLEDGKKFGWFYCWICQSSGGLKKLLRLINASQSCYDRLQSLTKDIISIKRKSPSTFYNEVVLPHDFLPLSHPQKSIEYRNAMAYLRKRGVLKEDILRYNIGYCEGDSEYRHHIVIPSYDAMGKLNFFIGRRYYDDDPGIPHKKPYASMDIVGFESIINYNEPLNLVEGIFDMFAVRNNAIPLFGKYPSKKLREKMILNNVKRVNIILDNDAFNDAINGYKLMVNDIPNISVHIVKLNGKDPSTLGFEKIHRLIHISKPFDEIDLLHYEIDSN